MANNSFTTLWPTKKQTTSLVTVVISILRVKLKKFSSIPYSFFTTGPIQYPIGAEL